MPIPPPPEQSFRTEKEAFEALYKHYKEHGYSISKFISKPQGKDPDGNPKPKQLHYLIYDKACKPSSISIKVG
jgi:hypothetical protein